MGSVLAEAMKTASLEPREPIWPTLEVQLRSGISQVLLGQTTAKVALDGVAADWQRSLRRAGLKGMGPGGSAPLPRSGGGSEEDGSS